MNISVVLQPSQTGLLLSSYSTGTDNMMGTGYYDPRIIVVAILNWVLSGQHANLDRLYKTYRDKIQPIILSIIIHFFSKLL